MIFSLLPPLSLVNCSAVSRAWRTETHDPVIVQNVILCFDRALQAQFMVRYDPDRLREELLKRCWIQAWLEKPIFLETTPLHPSGFFGKDVLPPCENGNQMILTNPNHPDLLGIHTKKSSLLFDRKTQQITTELKKPYNSFIERDIDAKNYGPYHFTDWMFIRNFRRTNQILCTPLDSKLGQIILQQDEVDLIACEDRVTVIDRDARLDHYILSQRKHVGHSVIDLKLLVKQFPEFHDYEVTYAQFVKAKQEKESCIIAVDLMKHGESTLIFLNICWGETFAVKFLGYHSIIDHAFNHIMVYEKAIFQENFSLIDSAMNKHLFCIEDLPRRDCSAKSYHNGCLAMLIKEAVQVWTFVEEKERIVPRHIRTIQVANFSGDFYLSKTGLTLVQPSTQANATDLVHTYRFLPPSQPKAEQEDVISYIHSRTIRQLFFSHLTPLDLLNVNVVCKAWHQDAHLSIVVRNVIFCFDRALGAESPVWYEPERLWEELLRRRWTQAWMEEDVIYDVTFLHPSGHIGENALPQCRKGTREVLTNPNHPDLLGIYSRNSFLLFDRKTKAITEQLKKTSIFKNEFSRYSQPYHFTNRMIVQICNDNRILCTSLDSKLKPISLGRREVCGLIACEDRVTVIDRAGILYHYTIGKRIVHSFINLNKAVLQFPEFHDYAVTYAQFVKAKQEKMSCIVAVNLKRGDEDILLFLSISHRELTRVKILGYNSIIDHAFNHVMKYERGFPFFLIDSVMKKHLFINKLPQHSGYSYHNRCLAMLFDEEMVQIWTFVEEEDQIVPRHIRTIEVDGYGSDLNLSMTGFTLVESTYRIDPDVVHHYRLFPFQPEETPYPPQPEPEKKHCTIQ